VPCSVLQPSLRVEQLASRVIGVAIEVHRNLGPGYLEVIYERAMMLELDALGIEYEQQVQSGVLYKGQLIGTHRIDLLIGGELVVELKVVEAIGPHHIAQVLSYLQSCNLELGLLINFSRPTLQAGLRRVIR